MNMRQALTEAFPSSETTSPSPTTRLRKLPQSCWDPEPSQASLWHHCCILSPSQGCCRPVYTEELGGSQPDAGSPQSPPALTTHRHPLSSLSPARPLAQTRPLLSLQQECFSGPGAPCSGAGLCCAPCSAESSPSFDAGAQAQRAGTGATSVPHLGWGIWPHSERWDAAAWVIPLASHPQEVWGLGWGHRAELSPHRCPL